MGKIAKRVRKVLDARIAKAEKEFKEQSRAYDEAHAMEVEQVRVRHEAEMNGVWDRHEQVKEELEEKLANEVLGL